MLRKDFSSTETHNLVCIEEISNEDIKEGESLRSLENTQETSNIVDKFEVVQGIPNIEVPETHSKAIQDMDINIPIHIINQDIQSPVEDIQNNNIIETNNLPTITPSEPWTPGRVIKLHLIIEITIHQKLLRFYERWVANLTFLFL